MNDLLFQILSVVVSAIIVPVISLIGAKIVNFLSVKIKNENAAKLFTTATNIVTSSVRTVMQTYVDSLKKEGKFDEASQILALKKAKNIALEQMSDEVKDFIAKNYGTLDSWLQTEIEATISKIKNV